MDGSSVEVGAPDHIERWQSNHKREISEVYARLQDNKAVFIEGPVKSGKTSLAIAVTNMVEKSGGDQHNTSIFFTTPAVQQAYGAIDTHDETGVTYKKLPPPDELLDSDHNIYVVIDEVSSRGPDEFRMDSWKRYIETPKAKFLLLMHPNRPANQEWMSLFEGKPTAFYAIGKSVLLSA